MGEFEKKEKIMPDEMLMHSKTGRKERRKKKARRIRRIAIGCIVLLLIVCTAVYFIWASNKDKGAGGSGNNISQSGGETLPTDTPQVTPGGSGGISDEMYPAGSITSSAELPNGKELQCYAHKTDKDKGKALLSSLEKVTEYDFPDDMDVSWVDYSANDSSVMLWGELDAGLFSYQNIRDSSGISIPKDSAEVRQAAKNKALQVAEELKPYTGELKIDYEQVVEPENGANTAEYQYNFVSAKTGKTPDGYEIQGTAIVIVEGDGFVQLIRSSSSNGNLVKGSPIKLPEDILGTFKEQNNSFDKKDAAVVITGYSIHYISSASFDGENYCRPILHIEYTVDREKAATDILPW